MITELGRFGELEIHEEMGWFHGGGPEHALVEVHEAGIRKLLQLRKISQIKNGGRLRGFSTTHGLPRS